MLRAHAILLLAAILGCEHQPSPSTSTPNTSSLTSKPLPTRSSKPGTLFERLPPSHTAIHFENRFDWDHEQKHLYPHGYAGGGVCTGDFDGDGLPDVYLVSQIGRDRLYRNLGAFRFEDVTDAALIDHPVTWGTGAAFADVDDDGDLDLFVCNYDAPNLLYLNDGDGTFREVGAARGVGFRGASVMAAFADYDLDGDLDVYLLTNRLYPGGGRDVPRTRQVNGKVAVEAGFEEAFAIQERMIDGETQKFVVKAGQRDRLYRNDGSGAFTDVSAEAGISGNHPGLSATWWDYDRDGRPDLYVGNDFWDRDRLYHNDGDGTFTDVAAHALPHTPWFSMGADFGDVDHDGRLDFLAADMSATTHEMAKIMMGDMNESRWFLESAVPRQYMRNAVYRNTGTDRFMEVAFLAGLDSTDWTWSVKFGDLDDDGHLDVFMTNGTANHSFDPDLTRSLRDLEMNQARRRVRDPGQRWEEQWRLYRSVPVRWEVNRAYRNRGDLQFEDVSETWGLGHSGISFGATKADLDRDGDLDIVVSNVDDGVGVFRNRNASGHRALVELRGSASNRFGVGAMVTIEAGGTTHARYAAATRGYMSADEPVLHFGLGAAARIDRLVVEWPSGHRQAFEDLAVDQWFVITEPQGPRPPRESAAPEATRFQEVAAEIGLGGPVRAEDDFDDYARQPLLPARHSRPGPGLAWGDADGDGDEDLFVGGAADRPGRLYLNEGGGRFRGPDPGPWHDDRACEDTAPLFLDVDGDGDQDLYVGSGSVECAPGADVLRDRLYLSDGAGGFAPAPRGTLPDAADSTGAVAAGDYDGDGDLDLFVGGRVIPGAYPLTPASRLLRNEGGRFVDATVADAPGLLEVGLVTGALWSDADGDGRIDLLLTLEWGPVSFWHNSGRDDGASRLVDLTDAAGLAARTGWWNGIAGADLDGDGDIDYVVTNAGLNTKYHASPEKPVVLYYGDFDDSGRMSLIEAKIGGQGLLPVRGLSCSSGAMPLVAERMPTYRAFASASLDEIYTSRCLEEATEFRATELRSGVLINEGAGTGGVRFSFHPLPRLAQAAPGQGVVASDLDGDGFVDVYIAQNFFWREPETGRWDGGLSILLRGDGSGGGFAPVSINESGLLAPGDARGLTVCDLDEDGRPDLLVARNDEPLLAFRRGAPGGRFLAVRLEGAPGNPTAVGARVTVSSPRGPDQTAEVHAGSGHLSQSSSWLFFGVPDESAGPDAHDLDPDSDLVEVHVRWPDGDESSHSLPRGVGRKILRHP